MKTSKLIKTYLEQEKPQTIILKNLHHDICPNSDYGTFRKAFARLEKQGEVVALNKGIYHYLKGFNEGYGREYFLGNNQGFLIDEDYLKEFNLDQVLYLKPTIYSNRVIGNSLTLNDGTVVHYYDYDPATDSRSLFAVFILFDKLNASYVLEQCKNIISLNYNDKAVAKIIRHLKLSRFKRLLIKNQLVTFGIKNNISLLIEEIS